MKKHLLSLLCLLAFALPGLAEVKSITLKPSDFGSGKSYITTETKKTIDGVEFGVKQINPSTGQIKKGDFYLYNNTEIPGSVTKVEIVEKSGDFTPKTTYLTLGDKPISGKRTTGNITGTETEVNGTKVIVLNATGNFKYFNLSGNIVTGTSYVSSITVYYSTDSSLPTTCTPPTFNIANDSEVPVGTLVRATCDTPNSTVTISGPGVAASVIGEEKAGYAEFTLTEDKLNTVVVLTATASVEGENGTITSDSKTIQFSVIEAPNTITDKITLGVNGFDFAGNGYSLKKYDSSATKVSYYSKGMKNYEVMQINTGSTSSNSNYKCGIISEENPDNLIIESVQVTRKTPLDDGSKDDKVIITLSNTPGSHTGAVNGTGKGVYVDIPNDGTIVNGIGDSETKTYTPQGDYKYFSLTTSGNQYIVSVVVNYRKPQAPETTEVTLEWDEVKTEYTVGQENEVAILYVTPEEAYRCVKVTSSDEEVATATFDEGYVSLNFLKSSDEPVVITATVDDPAGKFVAKENATFSFTVKDADVVLEPEAIVVTPNLDEDGYISVTTGSKITFSSKNATKLSVSIDGEETLEANPFVFTATEENEYKIVVVPVDSEGKPYENLKLEAKILAEKPIMTTSTYTFDFTNNSLLDTTPGYQSDLSKYFYALSEGVAMFRIGTYVAQNNTGQFSYVDNEGWKFGIDETNSTSFYINIWPTDGFDYEITSIKFNYAENESVEFSSLDNQTVNNEWTGKSAYVNVDVTALESFILNSIDVTFEHEVVPTPTASFRDNTHFTLAHEKGYDIYYKIENIIDTPQFRVINRDEMYEGHNKYNNEELSVNPNERISIFAQHPHGMVSKMLSATYDDIVTGIGNIAADSDTEVVYFNMQGVRVAEPTNGVYIRVANGKATKVVK